MVDKLAEKDPEVAIRFLLERAPQPIHALDAIACLVDNHGFQDDAAVDLVTGLIEDGTIQMSIEGVISWQSSRHLLPTG